MLPKIEPAFKNLIPPLAKEEREQLEQNILSCGKCRDALIIWNGTLIDGHNRFEICMKHGIQFEIKEMSFSSADEAKLWILDNQLGRRNLNDALRIELVLSKEGLLREKAKNNQIAAGGDKSRAGAVFPKSSNIEPINVLNTLAAEANVGNGTFHRYMQIKKDGRPALLEKVQSGEIKIGTAHRMLGKEIIKQLKQADKMYKAITKYEVTAEDRNGLAELRELLRGLLGKIERISDHAVEN